MSCWLPIRFRLPEASEFCAPQALHVTFPPRESGSTCSPRSNASAVGSDSTLLKEIPAEVNVHRTVTLDLPFGIKKRIKRLITGAKPSADTASATAARQAEFPQESSAGHFAA